MWKQFNKYFKQKYLFGEYYDDKIKELHELILGQLTMEEYAKKFLELLRYFRYIGDDKVKIQRFLSGLPQSYKDRIEFDEPRTLEEAIRKVKYCYDHNKGKPDIHKAWKDKKNENFPKAWQSHPVFEQAYMSTVWEAAFLLLKQANHGMCA